MKRGFQSSFVILLLLCLFTFELKASDTLREVSRFSLNSMRWQSFTTESGVLMVIPPRTFLPSMGGELVLEVIVERCSNNFGQRSIGAKVNCFEGSISHAIIDSKGIYFELPIPDFDWYPALFTRDSLGDREEIKAFPFSIEFPRQSLFIPTTCDGYENFNGYHDSIYSKSYKQTILFTREFQMRYQLLACEWEPFGHYLLLHKEPLHIIDKEVARFFLNEMVRMMDYDVPYRRDSILLQRFDFFESLQQEGIEPSSKSHLTYENFPNWRHCKAIVRKMIMKLPRKEWLHDRKFIPILINSCNWYGVASTSQ
jgi:hypothetical protein